VTTYLLDANVVIALSDRSHQDHDHALAWLSRMSGGFATCPITEGALTRYLIRAGHSGEAAGAAIAAIHALPGFEFWPDTLSYGEIDLTRLRGHREVTDTYLTALTAHHPDARLATFDKPLAAKAGALAELIP
jgi:toxin-antitoxin system PIN domain toxin